MFGFFESVEKKMRANASNWLELANKIYLYRRDELPEADRSALSHQMEGLRAQLREKSDASKLKLGIESLEGILRKTGGKFYPKSTIQEYVEFFLVAAIVVLGIRTYFVQPFKIPTNSMWPSFYGMTPETYPNPADAPSAPMQLARFLMFGAVHKEVVAPVSGEVSILVGRGYDGIGRIYTESKPGRKWVILSTTVRDYVFRMGSELVHLEVPEDFDFDPAFHEAIGISGEKLGQLWARAPSNGLSPWRWVTLDKPAERGKVFLSFDVMTGDQLFVDRFSYHFFRPKVGDGFVFRTGHIEGIAHDQYYIKRLVGLPGDTLEVKPPVLYRNGKPITGAKAFEYNANRVGKYRGYINSDPRSNARYLFPGTTVKVIDDGFFAMGDNSGNSADGRYWGFVPKNDVIGRPLWIYYPFTSRWGPSP